MILSVQIESFLFSFLYGLFFAFLFNLNYKYLFCKKLFNRILLNLFFNIDIFLCYFLLLKKLNYGIIHIYFLFFLYFGFILGNKMTKKLRKEL